MSLEIEGKVIALSPIEMVKTKNGESGKRYLTIETADKYPTKPHFEAFGKGCDALDSVKVGDEVKVFFNLDSSEWKEKRYSKVSLWKIEVLSAAPAETTAAEPTAAEPDTDNLPF